MPSGLNRKRVESHSSKMKRRYAEGRLDHLKPTEERNRQLSERNKAKVGELNPFFGKTHTVETKAKMSKAGKKRTGEKNGFFGKNHTLESCLKMSAHRGGNGVTFIPQRNYTNEWTHELRESIRKRDRYTCQIGGEVQGERQHSVHHIDYNKDNCDESNLVTLCVKCHCKTARNRKKWMAFFKTLNRRKSLVSCLLG